MCCIFHALTPLRKKGKSNIEPVLAVVIAVLVSHGDMGTGDSVKCSPEADPPLQESQQSLQLRLPGGPGVQAVTNMSGICRLMRDLPAIWIGRGQGLYTCEHRLGGGPLSGALPEIDDLCRNQERWGPCGWRSRCVAFTGRRCVAISVLHSSIAMLGPLKALWFVEWLLFLINASFLAFVTSPSLSGVGTSELRPHLPLGLSRRPAASPAAVVHPAHVMQRLAVHAPAASGVRRGGEYTVPPLLRAGLFLKPSGDADDN